MSECSAQLPPALLGVWVEVGLTTLVWNEFMLFNWRQPREQHQLHGVFGYDYERNASVQHLDP